MIYRGKAQWRNSFYDRLRDYHVTDEVKNLFLIRHTETEYNICESNRRDSPLTKKGKAQATALGLFFKKKKISYIFTSKSKGQSIRPKLFAKCRMIAGSFRLRVWWNQRGDLRKNTYEDIEKKDAARLQKKRGKQIPLCLSWWWELRRQWSPESYKESRRRFF